MPHSQRYAHHPTTRHSDPVEYPWPPRKLAYLPRSVTRLVKDVLKVTLNFSNALFIGDRSMTRYNCLHIHRQDAITGPQPVARRSRPYDGMATNKQDITRENNPVRGNMHQCI